MCCAFGEGRKNEEPEKVTMKNNCLTMAVLCVPFLALLLLFGWGGPVECKKVETLLPINAECAT